MHAHRRRFADSVCGAVVVLLTATAVPAVAEEPLHEQIDRLIAAKTPDFQTVAAPLAADAEFLRRVSLDLSGLLPGTDQTRAFLVDDDPHKRAKLIDRLLGSPEYARHMQRVFDVILMRRLPQKNVKTTQWEEYLRQSFAENKPWDQITREILTADGSDAEHRGPARFYLDREGDVNEITRDVARIFLGADLKCAQCHDHPEVEDWTQDDYYGLSAFLVRSFVFTDKQKKTTVFAEKADGEATFSSVFFPSSKKETARPQLFGGPVLDEPEFKNQDAAYKVKPAKNVRPIPKFSRRAQLGEMIVSSRRFARTTVNRLWAHMMGRGLVHPLDRDHSGNPPSHPELLKLLTDEFANHRYDIQWFLRELALSQTYQRSSRQSPPSADGGNDQSPPSADGGNQEGHQTELPPPQTFAVALLKPLSPAQFAWSVLQATGEADVQRKTLGDKLTEAALHQKLAGVENQFVSLFGGLPGQPPENFESTVDQVLFLSNDATILNLIHRKNGNLADRLLTLPADDPRAVADELFLSVLIRPPTEQDVQDVQEFLADKTGEARSAAVEELIWALIASSEFRFNH